MKKADQQIIDANPGLTAYDLMSGKGLSEAGFNELVALEDSKTNDMLNAQPAPTPPKKKPEPKGILQPDLSVAGVLPHMQMPGSPSGKVRLVPVSGGGIGTEMSRKAAEDTMRRQPNKYRIK